MMRAAVKDKSTSSTYGRNARRGLAKITSNLASPREGTATACQFRQQRRMIEHAPVGNEFGDASSGDIENARACARTTIAQTLIGGAEGMRCEKHVVKAK